MTRHVIEAVVDAGDAQVRPVEYGLHVLDDRAIGLLVEAFDVDEEAGRRIDNLGRRHIADVLGQTRRAIRLVFLEAKMSWEPIIVIHIPIHTPTRTLDNPMQLPRRQNRQKALAKTESPPGARTSLCISDMSCRRGDGLERARTNRSGNSPASSC